MATLTVRLRISSPGCAGRDKFFHTMTSPHNNLVIHQFTQPATVFATAPQFTDPQALDALLQVTGASADDTSLDVACGAGVVACHFAARVSRAVGIDITPAMLDKARQRQARRWQTSACPTTRWTRKPSIASNA